MLPLFPCFVGLLILFSFAPGTASAIKALSNLTVQDMKMLSALKTTDEILKFLQVDFNENRENRMINEQETKTGNYTPVIREVCHAFCRPRFTTVEIAPRGGNENEAVYIPSCVELERCGGCCFGSILSCQPIRQQRVTVKVRKITDLGMSTIIVNEIRHTHCSCECIRKQKDCSSHLHAYDAENCACQCKNTIEKKRCEDSTVHQWMDNTCNCKCIKEEDCSTGTSFSEFTCRCETGHAKRPRKTHSLPGNSSWNKGLLRRPKLDVEFWED